MLVIDGNSGISCETNRSAPHGLQVLICRYPHSVGDVSMAYKEKHLGQQTRRSIDASRSKRLVMVRGSFGIEPIQPSVSRVQEVKSMIRVT